MEEKNTSKLKHAKYSVVTLKNNVCMAKYAWAKYKMCKHLGSWFLVVLLNMCRLGQFFLITS